MSQYRFNPQSRTTCAGRVSVCSRGASEYSRGKYEHTSKYQYPGAAQDLRKWEAR